ncbi:50S ribosomal protein L16 3-hydroxylase [Comamonas odontotermitis]|uniref:50S ribosomal protein L16 3-hydroxylase n=1 Tax=Comamonas odontotermitis TaxID=379895 RepID=A0ABR6RGI4_9BURK|nr:cupin domain-containing protein [Comamonas odontotermitis]MBB6578203.1 50S ribosomal protein L16 3-hydroxylase [Comamonas odontotermitis]
MQIEQALPLLGGLSPAQFMRRYWQKKPLLVRGAVTDWKNLQLPLPRAELFELAGQEGVESRLIQQKSGAWSVKHGPFSRRAIPSLKTEDWTLLVQGVDLHNAAAHQLLQRFAFVPAARLDDLMISYASNGGGVGPHFDSYDVFLLQAHGKRRWRIGKQKNLTLKDGIPLKILAEFEAEEEYLLEPGDMLYLPPRYAHDGVAEGECMTYSIGFRSPAQHELAGDLLMRLSDVDDMDDGDTDARAATPIYKDPKQAAVETPGAIPPEMLEFARAALETRLSEPLALARALGESLTEPKANVWFEPEDSPAMLEAVALDRKTRMMYDGQHVFINGESYRAGGRDFTLMKKLADTRHLDRRDVSGASDDALSLLSQWCEDGWAHAVSR